MLRYCSRGSKIDCVVTRHRLVTAVSSVLESALGMQKRQKQAAEKAKSSVRSHDSTSLQKDPEACSWSFLGYKINAPSMPNLGGYSVDSQEKEKPSAGEACRSEETYADRVRVGMAADKAPAVAVRSLPTVLHPMSRCVPASVAA